MEVKLLFLLLVYCCNQSVDCSEFLLGCERDGQVFVDVNGSLTFCPSNRNPVIRIYGRLKEIPAHARCGPQPSIISVKSEEGNSGRFNDLRWRCTSHHHQKTP